MMIKAILKFTIYVSMLGGIAYANELSFPEQSSLLTSAQQIFTKQKLNEKYQFSSHVNPFFIQGDFDGDHKLDLAVLIIEKASGKKGIAIFHLGTGKITIISAGKSFGNGGDDFNWLDAWHAYPKSKVVQGADEESPPKLRGDALYVEKTESASAILYWNGSRNNWYQQGD